MLDIMTAAANAIEAYNAKLRTTSANIANMAVTGYKSINVSFQEIFNRLVKSGSAPSVFGDQGGVNPIQSGGGASVASMSIDFKQGEFSDGGNLALGIIGQGLFIVSNDGGSTYYYTRNGDFQISNGNLVTSTGSQVYGLDNSGSLVPITGLSANTYVATNLSFDTDGRLWEYQAKETQDWKDKKADTGFRIALTYFNNPGGLEYIDGTSFKVTTASGSPASATTSGGIAGTVNVRKLEQSNVFYIGETIGALEIQRAMSGNLTVIKMISDAISSFINKIS